MRIAFVSDIHGNLAALEAVARDIARRGIDEVVNLGDSLSGLAVPYDHESMARLADVRERPDWAAALRTGEMPRRRASPP